MIKKIYITIILILFTLTAKAEGKGKMAYRGFLGGMMVHSGYVCSDAVNISSPSGAQSVKAEGAPFGIGGAIRFLFGKHLRVGSEGYVSTLTYGEHKSKSKVGWGGLLADSAWRMGRFNLFVGGTIGGGAATNTAILSEIKADYIAEDFISYRKYGFFCLTPFMGAEFRVNKKVNLVLKADYLINLTNHQDDFVSGPRLYFGVMFGHTD